MVMAQTHESLSFREARVDLGKSKGDAVLKRYAVAFLVVNG